MALSLAVVLSATPPVLLLDEPTRGLDYATKARLAVLPSPAVPAALTARLLALAEPGGPVPPRPGPLPSQPRMLNVPARPSASRPQGSRPAGRSSRSSSPPRSAGRWTTAPR